MQYYNPLSTQVPAGPSGKAFEPHELRRIPVTLTDEARRTLLESSAEGRKFPQALSEIFGGVTSVKALQVDATPRSTHFHSGPEHFHPITGEEERILLIDILHEDAAVEPYRFFLSMRDVQEVHPAGRIGFTAVATARELVRLYPHK
jgi:hypothetical protein